MDTILNSLTKEQLQQVITKRACKCLIRELENKYNFATQKINWNENMGVTQLILKRRVDEYYEIVNYCIENSILVLLIDVPCGEYRITEGWKLKKYIAYEKSFGSNYRENWKQYIKRTHATQIFLHNIIDIPNTLGSYVDGTCETIVRMFATSDITLQFEYYLNKKENIVNNKFETKAWKQLQQLCKAQMQLVTDIDKFYDELKDKYDKLGYTVVMDHGDYKTHPKFTITKKPLEKQMKNRILIANQEFKKGTNIKYEDIISWTNKRAAERYWEFITQLKISGFEIIFVDMAYNTATYSLLSYRSLIQSFKSHNFTKIFIYKFHHVAIFNESKTFSAELQVIPHVRCYGE